MERITSYYFGNMNELVWYINNNNIERTDIQQILPSRNGGYHLIYWMEVE